MGGRGLRGPPRPARGGPSSPTPCAIQRLAAPRRAQAPIRKPTTGLVMKNSPLFCGNDAAPCAESVGVDGGGADHEDQKESEQASKRRATYLGRCRNCGIVAAASPGICCSLCGL